MCEYCAYVLTEDKDLIFLNDVVAKTTAGTFWAGAQSWIDTEDGKPVLITEINYEVGGRIVGTACPIYYCPVCGEKLTKD